MSRWLRLLVLIVVGAVILVSASWFLDQVLHETGMMYSTYPTGGRRCPRQVWGMDIINSVIVLVVEVKLFIKLLRIPGVPTS